MLVSSVELLDRPRFSDAYKVAPSPKDALLIKKEKLVDELTKIIASLPREEREDLEFYSRVLMDRHERDDKAFASEATTRAQYANAEGSEPRAFQVLEPVFKEIAAIQKVEYVAPKFNTPEPEKEPEVTISLEKVEPTEPEMEITELQTAPMVAPEVISRIVKASIAINTTNRRKVVKIKQAPQELINNVYGNVTNITPLVETIPEEPTQDTLSAAPLPEIDNLIEFPKAETPLEEEPSLNVFNTASLPEIDNLIEFPKAEIPLEEELPLAEVEISQIEEPESVAPTFEPLNVEEEKVYFEILPGMSLADIALALCGDVNGWMDLYYANKEQIEKVLIEKNYTNFNELEVDKEVFAGLTIIVPTVFKKEPVKQNEQAELAMAA